MHKNQFLSNYIIKQFDVKKFKKMIVAFLSIVDNFQHIIDKDEYYIKYWIYVKFLDTIFRDFVNFFVASYLDLFQFAY